MMGAIILQGMHFLAPRSTMVTVPLTGNALKSWFVSAQQTLAPKTMQAQETA
jgi:hypothetical protein